MEYKETHTATTQSCPIRLQEYGVGIFSRIASKSALKKALKKKLISVNGAVATTATFIHGGELIEYTYPQNTVTNTRLKLALEIVFEDEYVAVINKPAGILVSGNSFKTVANALCQNLKKSTANNAVLPQPVHRLDYPTTGLLLAGKTSESIFKLNELFKEKQIQKTYYAVTIGAMKTAGIINRPIDNLAATSEFKVIATVSSKRFGFLNLVVLHPKTGRRHQLRKHLFAIKNPILGDPDYHLPELALKGKGMYLHAYALQFKHPITYEDMHIRAKLPLKFKRLFTDISL